MRRLATYCLLFTLLFAIVSCAAMANSAAPQHPCCPASQQPDTDKCAKIGCIGTVPFIVPSLADGAVPMPAVAAIASELAAEIPWYGWVPAPINHPPEIGLFVAHHQFLI
jgi:hypothetical protein